MSVINITDEEFDRETAEGVGIVDFYSTHCGPCRVLLPVLLEVETAMPFIKLVKVNTDFCPELSKRFKISALPTVYFFKDGKFTEYHNGYDKDEIMKDIAKLVYSE